MNSNIAKDKNSVIQILSNKVIEFKLRYINIKSDN